MSGTLVKTVGFEWMLFGIALLNFIYAPLLYMLKSPPTKEEKKVRLDTNALIVCICNATLQSLIMGGEKSSVRYVTYQNEEEDE